MSAVCPQGHTSTSEDYCDICGAPIAPAGSAPAPVAPAETGAEAPPGPTACPHCGSPAAPRALFCENCGYDFTTGTPPEPLGLPDPPAPSSGPDPDPLPDPDPAAADPHPAEPDPAPDPDPDPAGLPTPEAPGPERWVAELWVDPDWYAAQQPEDPMPAPGSPRVIPLREQSVLVGRPSASRNIHPQVDAGADTGVSRRHCQLSTDGQRWWVEDLDSANGTFVGLAGEPLPTTPLQAGDRHELADGERVFVGGWTRLVIRSALPGEA